MTDLLQVRIVPSITTRCHPSTFRPRYARWHYFRFFLIDCPRAVHVYLNEYGTSIKIFPRAIYFPEFFGDSFVHCFGQLLSFIHPSIHSLVWDAPRMQGSAICCGMTLRILGSGYQAKTICMLVKVVTHGISPANNLVREQREYH